MPCTPTRSYTPSWLGLALGTGSCVPRSLPMRQNGRPGSEVKVRLRSMRWWASMENGSAGGRMSFSAFSFVKAQPQHAVFFRAHSHVHMHMYTSIHAHPHSHTAYLSLVYCQECMSSYHLARYIASPKKFYTLTCWGCTHVLVCVCHAQLPQVVHAGRG